MLRKLLKYELSAMGRILLPLYGALIFMSLIMGIVVNVLDVLPIFSGIVVFLYVAVAVGSAVMTVIIIVQRFYKNLLGNEGYLMFTLPVSIGKHVWNKVIAAGIWMSFGLMIGILSALIIVSSTGEVNLLEMEPLFGIMWRKFGAMAIVYLIEVVLLIFLAAAHSILRIYTAISIGHQWGNHRVLGAILAFLGLGIAETLVVSLLGSMGVQAVLIKSTRDMVLAFGEEATGHFVVLTMAILLAALSVIYYLVTNYLLKNRLNLE